MKIEQQALDFFELILLAREKVGVSKLLILKKADFKITTMKLFTRLAHDMKTLPQSRYIEGEKRLLELGKMLGGWIKYAKGPRDEALSDTSREHHA